MRVLSGIQPSGKLHIGNYFGAMKHHIELQEEHKNPLYFIADYHAITTLQGNALTQNILDVALDYVALGLDPKKTILFKQSDVSMVTELAWILSSVTPMGLLERCHSYKDKVSHGLLPNHGIFAYPVLMAADILIYQSQLVPVGKDQKQHIEVSRDIALKFNHVHGDIFTIPEEIILSHLAIIPGIDGQKMSKSYNNTIEIFEDENLLRKKVMRIVTDCKQVEEAKDPKTCNLFKLYQLFATKEEEATLAKRYKEEPLSYKEVKEALYEKIVTYFKPFKEKRSELARDIYYVKKILQEGAEKANIIANETMIKVRKALGVVL
ncbi:tryptophan--tRNA ligase [Candidatus Auribacterota bacterium]